MKYNVVISSLNILCSVGVGFDTKGAGSIVVKGLKTEKEEEHVVEDSREGIPMPFPSRCI